MKLEHWQTMVRARALENGCYVIAPDQLGNIYIGHSMVVDPFGRSVVEMNEREGLEIAEIEPRLISEVRKKLPLLKNRRADVYDIDLRQARRYNPLFTNKGARMILSKNADVKALIVKTIEGKPMNGELLVKPLIKGDEMTLVEIHYQPGVGAPLHVHSHESLAYVVKGKVRMTVGKEVYVLGPGDVCRHPEGVPHGVEALDQSIVVEIKSPAPDIATFLGT